jgi:putative pyruvate formate lyase activating enzyme
VASYVRSHSEEAAISGWNGSGLILFAQCNMACQFCNTAALSLEGGAGYETDADELAEIMLELQDLKVHNINLMSPSHVVPQILDALRIAIKAGFKLPLVYNSGGYDAVEMLKLLDGVVDIYLPDMKFGDALHSDKYALIADYPEVNRAVVKEMHRQVGDLVFDSQGLAKRGLLVRHLVMPYNAAETELVMQFLAREISPDTYLNLMDCYEPVYNVKNFPEINRKINDQEYEFAVLAAQRAGLTRLENGRQPIPVKVQTRAT